MNEQNNFDVAAVNNGVEGLSVSFDNAATSQAVPTTSGGFSGMSKNEKAAAIALGIGVTAAVYSAIRWGVSDGVKLFKAGKAWIAKTKAKAAEKASEPAEEIIQEQ